MKITTLLVFALLLIPAWAMAQDTAAQSAPAKTFIIHLVNGGEIETDNFVKENGRVKVMLPNGSGSISLDKAQVKSIEEVQGIEREHVKTIESAPSAPQPQRPSTHRTNAPSTPKEIIPYEPTDNNGHTEKWWRSRIDKLKKDRAFAEKRYKEAEAEWNQYVGIISNLGPSAAQYDIIKYQDLRGAARVKMDQAQADMDDIDHQLNESLPEEARKAGAPPGWVR